VTSVFINPEQGDFNHKPSFQSPAEKLLYLFSDRGRCTESVMSRVDWNLAEAELHVKSAAKRKKDHPASEPSEAELLKHIEDALLMDTTNPDRAGAGRG
jgi:hypothetical protein